MYGVFSAVIPRLLSRSREYGERPEQQQTLKIQNRPAAKEKRTASQVVTYMFLPMEPWILYGFRAELNVPTRVP